MKPDSFPSLIQLSLDSSNIVTIPRSISRFTTLQRLSINNCESLREIPRLPQSIREVHATDCTSLDLPSSCRLLNQFQEIFMDPSFSHYGSCRLVLPRIEIPKGYKLNHQSVGNSVSFRVGREFQKIIVCFAFRSLEANATVQTHFVVSCTNGFSEGVHFGSYCKGDSEHLLLKTVNLWEWNKSNPSGQNLVTITVEIGYLFNRVSSYSDDDPKITWVGESM